jgi:hypothetical protein
MAENPSNEQKPDSFNARAETPGRTSKLVPEHLVRFLELLAHNGNISLSARMIGWSRSTIYAFAGQSPSFKEAMREAVSEGRELLVGEGWRRATRWIEHTDTNGELHVKPPSDRLLGQLIGGYFSQFKPGRGEDTPPDELIPETADLTKLSDRELELLEQLLTKLGAEERVGARES